jgi:hypothetical protein
MRELRDERDDGGRRGAPDRPQIARVVGARGGGA